MGGRFRHVGGGEGGVLPAQHRQDLLAEQVQLLQHGLQGQAGVVDQEQLALVVAEVLAEGEGLFDDFLRAADRQRGLRGEVLQRGAVAVDRGVIEVRAELLDCVLGVLPHEELAAEADDGLVCLAVAVVLVAFAVETDQLLVVLLGPEDVVGEEAVAVVRGHFGDLRRANGAMPDEGGHAVERARG
ncbi:hypothetical protein D9M72_497510 [compost metagenome]